jgi:aryl-alcohol dehydrogenase-like predicted oxidoreductase
MWNMFYNLSQPEVNELVKISTDNGINFFDTADVYGDGEDVKILGLPIGT